MNREAFFAALRKRDSGVFGTSLTQTQVEGVEAILDEVETYGCDLGQAAYVLATGYGETGAKMVPVRENMNYSARRIPQVFSRSRLQGLPPSQLAGNPKLLANTVYGGEWGQRNLGNIPGTDDGWNFRGALVGQITGRANITKWSKNLGLDLVNNPHLLDRLDVGVRALVRPMMEGWATGAKLPTYVQGGKRDYVGARAVWNGSFEASKYAGYARAFERALAAGGYAPRPKPVSIPAIEGQGGGFGTILRAIIDFLTGGKA